MAVPVKSKKCSAQTLPEEIQTLLNNSTQGVVYVSFDSCNVPEKILEILIESFGQLNKTVLWEQGNKSIELPSNIIAASKLSHNASLAHKNTQLLITNGETTVLKLALYYGIPMLIIPFENNQLHSAIKCIALENVSMLQANDVTHETFSNKLNAMLADNKFKIRAREISKLIQHRSNSDCELWKESIIRQKLNNKSAVHLHLDALGGLFFVIFVVVKVSLKLCQFYNSWHWFPTKVTKKNVN